MIFRPKKDRIKKKKQTRRKSEPIDLDSSPQSVRNLFGGFVFLGGRLILLKKCYGK